jgi:outer membrane putative beta-barrel porin/alpha-amylase
MLEHSEEYMHSAGRRLKCRCKACGKSDRKDCGYSRGCFALALIAIGLSGTVPLHGQTATGAEAPISTDRPSVANSSVVVPKGTFQAENGLLITDTQGQYIVDLPETALRFGLLNKTELRFSAPDYFCALSTGNTAPSGLGDIAIGVKQQLGPTRGNFNLSVIIFLSLPSGAKAVSSHGYDPGLQLPWSRSLSESWTTSGQVAFYWPTQAGKHNFTNEATFVLDRQLTKPWDAFVEYAGDFPQRGGLRQLLHFGSAYKLAPRHQIDFQIAAGLSRAAPDLFVGIGYSFLLRVAK